MAHLRDKNGNLISDDEFYKNIREGSIEKGTMSQAHSKEMRNKYGDTLSDKFDISDLKQKRDKLESENKNIDDEINSLIPQALKGDEKASEKIQALNNKKLKNQHQINNLNKAMKNPMTFAQVASNIAESQIDSQYGQALGIRENLNKNNAMYMENAEYGEMSKQQTTNARVNQLGGIDKAVAFDVAGATVKTAKDKGALIGEVEEALKATGMDKEKAKALAEAIVEGSKQGAEEFKKALEKMKGKAETLTGAKERSDYAAINTAGGSEKYKEAAAINAVKQESALVTNAEVATNPELKNKILQNEYNELKRRMGKEVAEKYKEDALEYGFAKLDENGNLVAADAEGWVKGRTEMMQAGMDKMDKGFIAGGRLQTMYNPKTGEVLVNFDKSQSFAKGNKFNANADSPGSMDAQEKREWAELLSNPKKLATTLFGKGVDELSQIFQKYGGMSPETANFYATAIVGTGTTVSAAAATEAAHTLYNLANGKRVATKDFKYINAKGEKVSIHKGKEFKLSDIPEQYRDLARENSKVEPGFVRKLVKNSWDTLGDVKDGLLEKLKPTSFSAEQKTTNSGNTHQQQSSKESVKQESKHNEPPSSNSTSSINDTKENVKILKLFFVFWLVFGS